MIKIKKLSEEKLENIKGGATITLWTGIVIASLIVFISGIFEGITDPKECRS